MCVCLLQAPASWATLSHSRPALEAQHLRHQPPHTPPPKQDSLLQPLCNLSLSLTRFVPRHPKFLTWSGGSVWEAQSPLDLTTAPVLPKVLLLAVWYPTEVEPELAAGSYRDVSLGLILS